MRGPRLLVPFAVAVVACGGRTPLGQRGPADAGVDADADATIDASDDACVPRPEVCNGEDDDCDGVVDGPQADVWCDGRLDHVDRAACRQAECRVDLCTASFGDCNRVDADGCEATLVLLHADLDGDSFGAGPAAAQCPKEPGWVKDDTDCFDGNASASPGQTAWFGVDRGDGSFDYDCDGKETRELPDLAGNFCVCSNGTCSIGSGWSGSVPACGKTGGWREKDLGSPGTCAATIVLKPQRCR